MDAKEAREIVSFVEDSEGNVRLDNMVREPRYQFAKGYIHCLEEGPEVKSLEADNSRLKAENEALLREVANLRG